jgi:hypothetical protein
VTTRSYTETIGSVLTNTTPTPVVADSNPGWGMAVVTDAVQNSFSY